MALALITEIGGRRLLFVMALDAEYGPHLKRRFTPLMTGIGPVAVCQPRVRDRGAVADAERIRFTPAILPPYARRSKSLEATRDFEEALAALLGKDPPGLSASTISRLKEAWGDEHNRWKKRDLSARRTIERGYRHVRVLPPLSRPA